MLSDKDDATDVIEYNQITSTVPGKDFINIIICDDTINKQKGEK